MPSMCVIAWLTWSMPADCSALAAAISATMSPTFLTLSTISASVCPDVLTNSAPLSTLRLESWIRSLISRAASALRLARLRTSDATTAKPRPCSPARAASTDAFNASRLVWNAISSMTPTISAIFFDDVLICCIASIASLTTSPPRSAVCRALPAS